MMKSQNRTCVFVGAVWLSLVSSVAFAGEGEVVPSASVPSDPVPVAAPVEEAPKPAAPVLEAPAPAAEVTVEVTEEFETSLEGTVGFSTHPAGAPLGGRLGTAFVGLDLEMALDLFELVPGVIPVVGMSVGSSSASSDTGLFGAGLLVGARWRGPVMGSLQPTALLGATARALQPKVNGAAGEWAVEPGALALLGIDWRIAQKRSDVVFRFEAGYAATPATTLRLAGTEADTEAVLLGTPAVRIGEVSRSGAVVRFSMGSTF